MKKLFILFLALSLIFCLFSCASNIVSIEENDEINELEDEPDEDNVTEETEKESTIEETEAQEKEPEIDLSFLPVNFLFSSGAGGWGTTMTLNADGSFNGFYQDSDMGSVGDSYPYGTAYICDFSGKFDIKQINSYSYSLTVTEFASEQADGDEWIEDGIRYIGSEAYGFSGCTEFILYTADAPESEFTEDFKSWSPGRYNNEPTVSSYAIYNTADGYGFFEYNY